LIFKKTNQIKKSEESFSKAVKLNPHNHSNLCNLGEAFLKNKKYQLAKEAFKQAIKISPNYIPALNNLALLLKETKNYQSALEIFEQLLILEPNDPDVINNIGTVCMSMEKDEQAKEYFEQVIQLHPSYFGAYINLGDLEYRKGNKEKSTEHYEQAIKLAPNSAILCKHLADHYLEKNEFEKSGEYYIQAIENDPGYQDAIEGYLSWFIQQEEWEAAEFYLKKILPEFPESAFLNCISSKIHANKEHSYEAIKEARLAIKLDPSNTDLYTNLGEIYQKFSMSEEARKNYQEGINNETDKSQLYFEWALLEEKNLNYDKAAMLCNKALILDPELKNNVQILLSSIAGRNKDFDVAINALEKIEIDTNELSFVHKNLLFEKGNIFDKMGRYDDAFNCFTKASEIRGKLQNRHFDPENYKDRINSITPATLANLPVLKGTNSKF